jgi:hypothetical protein
VAVLALDITRQIKQLLVLVVLVAEAQEENLALHLLVGLRVHRGKVTLAEVATQVIQMAQVVVALAHLALLLHQQLVVLVALV